MAPRRSKTKRTTLLSHTRPPTVRTKHAALSSRATRTLIRSHHRLLKKRVQALEAQDEVLVGKIDAQIQENGGLESYQLASKLGQSLERGGDSSKVLVDWLSPQLSQLKDTKSRLRVLEVGALSTKNACSTNQCLDVTRIDLNSQEPGILKQDFMEMPLPRDTADQFHIISLSLVLNYVPDAVGRGEMLKRCVAFLRKTPLSGSSVHVTPRLFLVLPVACVNNSRYLTESKLQDIMSSMGFVLTKSKETSKLIFQLWEHNQDFQPKIFKKEILRPGRSRNNFAIVVK
ncbi:25S rRNA (adenine2142-N1)-methyltransferase [Aspergillus alliaceus]|uniref:25S rRNA (adenine2142-N1)-methyltransferase n=1 Tax=Petromyces alliaceus TaxID=209559 RepID=UPI0012A3D477|nr:putative methyltransferase-domain-containing protein [Aspergillus alliaceus]KAB8232168.1 putative methyltransferase-domain-containing protein [Aspergillus alliaceus]